MRRRDWRADRRPPYPATDADTIGLRLSARHPLLRDGLRPPQDAGDFSKARMRSHRGNDYARLFDISLSRGEAHDQRAAQANRMLYCIILTPPGTIK
jgi:hypothetical protein